MRNYGIAVIGGGPGGYTSAIRAAQLGAKVVLVEKDEVGGMCLHRGCIPTKTLLHATSFLRTFKKAREYGINAQDIDTDFSAIQERKESIVAALHTSLQTVLTNNKIDIIKGRGELVSPGRIAVSISGWEEIIGAERIIVAPGSVPTIPPVPGALDAGILTTTDMLKIARVPASLLIIGGGVSGVEFASVFSGLGTKVTIVEKDLRLIPTEDEEISQTLKLLLKSYGVTIYTGCRVKNVRKDQTGVNTVTLYMENEEKEISAELLLSCTGRRPNIEDLGTERLGIIEENGSIQVNRMMETTIPGVYAVGDAAGGMMLAHKAQMEGIVAAENALGARRMMDVSAIPRVIHCQTEIAGVGLTERQARDFGNHVIIGRYQLSASGMASILREKGFMKIIANRENGKVLGVHIFSPGASELIGEAALAMKLGAGIKDIADTVHNHPSFSEGFSEAARDAFGEAIYVNPRSKITV